MPSMDVFNTDAFAGITLTAAVNKLPYLPTLVRELGLFEGRGVPTTQVMIEEKSGTLTLVPTSPRGAPPAQQNSIKRTARSFIIPRLSKSDTIQADEIQGVRAFGSESELQLVEGVVNDRLVRLRRDIEYTWENLFLGAAKGVIYDSDGSTVIYNLFTEFGVSQISEIDFDLDNASPADGAVREACADVVRNIIDELGGLAPANIEIIGLASDTFFDDLVNHSETREIFKNWEAARTLRGGYAYQEFSYGGIRFINYRGTSSVGVTADKCNFFPANVPGLFQVYYGPADTMDFVNTMGLPLYAMQALDPKFSRYVEVEVQSNPLPICTIPRTLLLAKRT